MNALIRHASSEHLLVDQANLNEAFVALTSHGRCRPTPT